MSGAATGPRRYATTTAVIDHWAERLIEWGKATPDQIAERERFCFACGLSPLWTMSDFDLARAHILARTKGGSDGVENLHLLCDECHKASEGLDGDVYWTWFHDRRLLDSILQLLANSGMLNLSALLDPSRLDQASRAIERYMGAYPERFTVEGGT